MTKVIFLDIDGVLNRAATDDEIAIYHQNWTKEFENKIICLNPDLVTHLKRILDETGSKIVISSTWRMHDDHPTVGDYWRKTLAKMLGYDPSVFIGNTPYLSVNEDRRGLEIKSWIENNLEPGTFRYAVVDDSFSDIVNVIPNANFFQTDYKVGLTSDIASAIVKHLNG